MIPRADALASLEHDEFDLVVIGGGITGAGVALDAASRGYSVALVERDDYASGTSSRSSKLVHGGLRYLQNFDLGLVREALLERSLMVNLAPHLVKPLPLLVPTFEGKRPDRVLGVGLNMYDVMAWRRGRDEDEDWSPERHRIVDGAETAAMLPALAARDPTAAYLFYDCQTDDVRLVLTVLGEAERFGAVCVNGCEVNGLVERAGRAAGVLVSDREDGGEFELIADNVVNATGVWADQLRPDELHDEEEMPRIRPSRGTHVLLSRDDLPLNAAAIVPAEGDRTIFVLPWLGRTLIGTTDNDYEGELEHIPPADDDIEYLLRASNEFFGTSLSASDLMGAYAGVRPLISTGDPRSRWTSRARPSCTRRARGSSRSPAASSPPGAGWRSWPSTGSWSARAARRRAAPTRSRSACPRTPRPCPFSTGSTTRRAPTWPTATATPRVTCSSWCGRSLRSASASAMSCPTSSPRPRSPRGASRRARLPTCCCAGRASA